MGIELDNSISLRHCIIASSERALSLTWLSGSHPIHPPGGAWEWGCLPPDALTRSRFCNERDFYFEYFTFHLLGRRSLIHLHHHRHHCPLPLISSSSSRRNIIQWVVNHFSTRRDDAPEDNTYMSLGKRDDTASKVSEGFHRMKVELPWPPFSPLVFLQFEHMLCPFNSMKKALRSSLIFLSAYVIANYMVKHGYQIFVYSHTYLCRVSWALKIQHIVFKQMARISWQQLAVRRRQILRLLYDLNKIHLKNKRFSWVGIPVYGVSIASY